MKISKFLKQTLVYWGNPQPNGYGSFTYDAPVELDCRWTDRKEKFLGKSLSFTNYVEMISNAVLMIDEDLDVGGQVALTTLDQLSSSQLPEDNEGYEIKAFKKTPDVRASNFVRQAWL